MFWLTVIMHPGEMRAAVIMHGSHMRRRGDAGEGWCGHAEGQDGWDDGSPDAHDSSRATPRARSRPCAATLALMAFLWPWKSYAPLRQVAVLPERHDFVSLLRYYRLNLPARFPR